MTKAPESLTIAGTACIILTAKSTKASWTLNSLFYCWQVLYKFLAVFAAFDWDKYCLSLQGPVPLSEVAKGGEEMLPVCSLLQEKETVSSGLGFIRGRMCAPQKLLSAVYVVLCKFLRALCQLLRYKSTAMLVQHEVVALVARGISLAVFA